MSLASQQYAVPVVILQSHWCYVYVMAGNHVLFNKVKVINHSQSPWAEIGRQM